MVLKSDFIFENVPSYVGAQLNRTRSYQPRLTYSLISNTTRNLRLVFSNIVGYYYASNDIGQDDKYIQEALSASCELSNLFKRFYFNTNYRFTYFHRIDRGGSDVQNHILNLAVGCKVLKKRGDISFTAYDVLNRNSGFSTAMYSDYIRDRWTRSFGRYFTFNLAYKFNRSKSGTTNTDIIDGAPADRRRENIVKPY